MSYVEVFRVKGQGLGLACCVALAVSSCSERGMCQSELALRMAQYKERNLECAPTYMLFGWNKTAD